MKLLYGLLITPWLILKFRVFGAMSQGEGGGVGVDVGGK